MDNNEARNLFSEYIHNISAEDEELLDMAEEFEDKGLFNDMRLLPGSCVDPFISYEMEDDEGNVVTCFDGEDLYIGINDCCWRFYVKDLSAEEEGLLGRTFPKECKVEIDKKVCKDKTVVLHEMIHVYEAILGSLDNYLRDIITFALYEDLSTKIPDLKQRVIDHANTVFNDKVLFSGGRHDILFFLKSLDLDIRFGLKLGTVMGYGRENYASDEV